MEQGIIDKLLSSSDEIQKEKDNSLNDNTKTDQNEKKVEVSPEENTPTTEQNPVYPDGDSKNPMDNIVPQQDDDYKQSEVEQNKQETSEHPPQTTDELHSYLGLTDLKPFHKYDFEKDEKRVQRQQQAVSLGNAFRALAQTVATSKGAYTTRNAPDRNLPRLNAELQRLREMQIADARSVQLENYRRGITLHNLAIAADRSKIARDRNKIARENAAMNYDIQDRKMNADADYRKGLVGAAKVRSEAELVRAKAYDYYMRHHKPSTLKTGKPYLSVNIGGENKQFSKEDVNNMAKKWIAEAQKMKQSFAAPLPDFIQNMLKSDAPLSDAQSKELVKWMFYPKTGGSGVDTEPVYPYDEKNTNDDPLGLGIK